MRAEVLPDLVPQLWYHARHCSMLYPPVQMQGQSLGSSQETWVGNPTFVSEETEA